MGIVSDRLLGTHQPLNGAPKEQPPEEGQPSITLIPRVVYPVGEDRLTWYGLVFQKSDGTCLPYEASELAVLGISVFDVAGASERSSDLQQPCFDVAKFLKLVLENDIPQAPNAVSVWDESGTTMIGYVPGDLAGDLRSAMREHPEYKAIALAYTKKGRKRLSLTVLFGALDQLPPF